MLKTVTERYLLPYYCQMAREFPVYEAMSIFEWRRRVWVEHTEEAVNPFHRI